MLKVLNEGKGQFQAWTIIIIIIIIIIIMDEMAFILSGWQPQMRETHMVCNLLLHHGKLILNKFTIYGIFGEENLASCLAGDDDWCFTDTFVHMVG